MKTRAELCERVLRRLGVLAAGQAPSAEEIGVVDGLLDAILAQFRGEDIVSLPSVLVTIDDALFEPVADLVAFRVSEDFGIPIADQARLKGFADAAEVALRRIQRIRPTYAPLKVDYF